MSGKGLGQRTKPELEACFGQMYSGWDRGVNVEQEKHSDGETKFVERPMTELELAARFVAAEIGLNIYEICNSAAFAPIVTFSQIQAHIGPVFESLRARAEAAEKTIDLLESNARVQAKLLADTGRERDELAARLRS